VFSANSTGGYAQVFCTVITEKSDKVVFTLGFASLAERHRVATQPRCLGTFPLQAGILASEKVRGVIAFVLAVKLRLTAIRICVVFALREVLCIALIYRTGAETIDIAVLF
jgi:hypothetical protein